jgi:hypothetical protein
VERGPVRRTFDLPAGEPRLTAQAVGVHGVWVNGARIVARNGEPQLRPGRKAARTVAAALRRVAFARQGKNVRKQRV